MKIHRTLATAVLATALAALAGCSDEPATGGVTFHLTDAPFPRDMIDEAELGIDGVEVHVTAEAEGESGFHVVSDSSRVLNLLDLSNGFTALIGHADLPVGEIKQMRLLVSSAAVHLRDGRDFDLDVPSGESSGLKVFFDPPIDVVAGETTDVLIDVDVDRSFSSVPASPGQMANITGFHFHPVLRVAVTDATGTLAGSVTASADGSPIENAIVSLWKDGAAVTSTATDVNGDWMILGVAPGTQIVRAEATGFTPAQTTATVTAGSVTSDVDLALDAAP